MTRLFLALSFAALITFVPQAHATDDRVSFLNDIEVPQGEDAQDAVCFLCSIRVEGTVRGSAVAFLGNISVDGDVKGDAVDFLGRVNMGEDARIAHDCVVFGGGLHRRGAATVGEDMVVFPFALILIPILGVIFIVSVLRAIFCRRRMAYPFPPV